MANELQGKRVAILTANEGVERAEYVEPRKALEDAGATVELVAPEKGDVQMMNHSDKADSFPAERALADARAETDGYDALVLPGGVKNPDKLRMEEDAIRFIQDFVNAGKPIAAICHGPWTLVEADAVRGRTLTSYPSIKTDIRNAGGNWVDEEVCVDQGLVTSRTPDDLPAFNAKMIEEFAEGAHEVREKAGAGASAS